MTERGSVDLSELGAVYGRQGNPEKNADVLADALSTFHDITCSGMLMVEIRDGFEIDVGEGWQSQYEEWFRLQGTTDGSIVGVEPYTDTTPLLTITRRGTPHILVENLLIYSDGSGIKLEKPGAGTVLRNIRIQAAGQGHLDLEEWSDVDFDAAPNKPRMLCGYGLWLNNADGGHLENVTMYKCGGHGMIATRWHDGHAHVGQIHGCHGCGFKGERVNGTEANIRCESNAGYGLMMKFCCERANAWPGEGYHHPRGAQSWFKAWCENNNGGNQNRQTKLERVGDLELKGHFGRSGQ